MSQTLYNMKKVCIRGNSEYPEKVIGFLKMLGGGDTHGWYFASTTTFYCIKDGGVRCFGCIPDGYTEITFSDACAILEGKAVLNDDCTVIYKSELPKFPCEMWVWDDYKDKAALREIHAYAPTLEFGWIGRMAAWKNASLTDPRIEETITIEEAEKRLNVKIRR